MDISFEPSDGALILFRHAIADDFSASDGLRSISSRNTFQRSLQAKPSTDYVPNASSKSDEPQTCIWIYGFSMRMRKGDNEPLFGGWARDGAQGFGLEMERSRLSTTGRV